MPSAALVLDASAALAVLLAESEGGVVEKQIRAIISGSGQIFVPGLFWYELGNGMLAAERRRRITSEARVAAGKNFTLLPIVTDQAFGFSEFNNIMNLAGKLELTYCDACYLELAIRHEIPLLSCDKHLLTLKSRYPLILSI